MINVLVTACGCPGGPSVIRALKEEFWVVGTDCSATASGRHFADAFYQVPRGDDPEFINALLKICAEEKIDIVLPESSHEVEALAEDWERFGGTTVMLGRSGAIGVTLDKVLVYRRLNGVVPLPEWYEVRDVRELRTRAQLLGYYLDRPIVVKPAVGKGAKGFRLVKREIDRSKMDMHQWPNSHTVTLDEIRGPWPLMVMEHLKQDPNEADAVDLYVGKDGTCFGVTKCRRDCRMGVHYEHEAKWDQQLWDQSVKVVETLGLEHFVNVQWMGGKLLEVNPRISTNFYPPGVSFPLAGVRAALGMDPGWERPPDGTRVQYYLSSR
jgi:carbamoyl-phosphate synthase large subunit